MIRRAFVLSLSLTVFVGCSRIQRPDASEPAPVVTTTTAPNNDAAAAPKLSNEVHWSRNSAEHRAVFLQSYAFATEIVTEKASTLKPGTWAVILDADETVIDNSQYQKELALSNQQYTSATWNAWCLREEAKPLPGSIAFLEKVHELAGKITIVTNREEAQCEATANNFRKEGIPFDQILCRTPQVHDKNPRFEAVQNGMTPAGWPATEVILWVGDNIQDFPGIQQKEILNADNNAYGRFASDYIVLPNPMYGSWQKNPMN